MLLSLISLATAAEECICPEEDPAQVYSRAQSAMLVRSGESLPTELNPLIALKGALPDHAYITETWDACDLEAGPPGSMMLLITDANGLQTRCGGAGPLSQALTGQRASGESDLTAWLRLGGWSDEPLPADLIALTLDRELQANPLEYPEESVEVSGYTGLDIEIGRSRIRSTTTRPEGPRWMVLSSLRLDDSFFYIHWVQEVTGDNNPWQWESHSMWQRTEAGLIPLWRQESRHIPILETTQQPEVLAAVPLETPAMLATMSDGSSLVMIAEDELSALTLDPERGWSRPEPIATAANDPLLVSAGNRAQVVWSQGTTLHTRHFSASRGWGKPLQIAEGIAEDAAAIAAMSRGGDVLVSWLHADGTRWVRLLSSNGEWDEATPAAPAGATHPHAVINQSGTAAMVWAHQGAIQSIRHSRGSWSPPRTISQSNETADAPQVGIDRWGQLLVAWRSTIEGPGLKPRVEIFARTWIPLRGWQPLAQELLTSRRGEISPPAVVTDAMGESVVIWLERGIRVGLWARHHTLRRGWTDAEHVLGIGDAEVMRPQVVGHGGGSVTAVWLGQDSAWTSQFIHGLSWGRVAAVESADMPVHDIAISTTGESNTIYLWTQGDREPVQLLVREVN